MKTLLLFADCLTYPGKEGVSQHIFGLLEALSATEIIRPVLLLCDRGTMQKSQFESFRWPTVLVTPSTFYSYAKIKPVIDTINPDIIQSYSTYQARLIASRYSIDNKLPLVMEHHDVDEEAMAHYKTSNYARSYQLDAIELASLNRTLSSRDAEILARHRPNREHTFISMPSIISPVQLSANSPSSRSPEHVLFIGNGAYPPNKRAIDYICKNLAPKLPQLTFHLVGRLTDRYNNMTPNIIGHGMIDDLSPILEKAGVGIAPLDRGSGLKIKVMTYLSAGLPVIGTEIALQGYRSSPAITESSLEDFVDVLLERIGTYDVGMHSLARDEYYQNYLQSDAIDHLVSTYNNLTYDVAVDDKNSKIIYFDIENLPWLKEFRESPYPACSETTYINWS